MRLAKNQSLEVDFLHHYHAPTPAKHFPYVRLLPLNSKGPWKIFFVLRKKLSFVFHYSSDPRHRRPDRVGGGSIDLNLLVASWYLRWSCPAQSEQENPKKIARALGVDTKLKENLNRRLTLC